MAEQCVTGKAEWFTVVCTLEPTNTTYSYIGPNGSAPALTFGLPGLSAWQ